MNSQGYTPDTIHRLELPTFEFESFFADSDGFGNSRGGCLEEIVPKTNISLTAKPICIMENGIAGGSNSKRAEFIENQVLATSRGIRDGMNVRVWFY